MMHIALGAALQITKGLAAPEVEHTYARAYALCQHVEETSQLVPVLFGLWRFHIGRSHLHMTREIGEMLQRLAQRAHDPTLTVIAHYTLGFTWLCLGVFSVARRHFEAGIDLYTPDQSRAPTVSIGHDLGVGCHAYAAMTLWLLGYPDQAVARLREALALADTLSHPFSLAWAQSIGTFVTQFRRDVLAAHAHAEAVVALSIKLGRCCRAVDVVSDAASTRINAKGDQHVTSS
jgi:predicted ATPase